MSAFELTPETLRELCETLETCVLALFACGAVSVPAAAFMAHRS